MPPDPISTYINGPMRRIEGWYTELDATITAAIARDQNDCEVEGSVGEIGVHHGRTFVALALSLKNAERAFAIDVFDDQDLNEDNSGCGNRNVFVANLTANGIDQDRVAVLQGTSLKIGWNDIEQAVGSRARLFSIDGGHTAPVVENDLEIAHAALCDAGVVITDDYFNPGYPGVSEGTARFLIRHPEALRPFAIGDSRVFFCRPACVDHYRRVLEASPAGRRHSLTASMWGSTVSLYRTPRRPIDKLRGLGITNAVLRHPWGQLLKPAIRRLLA